MVSCGLHLIDRRHFSTNWHAPLHFIPMQALRPNSVILMGKNTPPSQSASSLTSSHLPLPPHAYPSTPLQALRPESVILMGKNTMMKRSIRLYCEETGNDQWAPILDMLVGNVGIVFTKADLSQVRGVFVCRQRECFGTCMPT
jgi:hypothetical protein